MNNEQVKEIELLPCPFCGVQVTQHHILSDSIYHPINNCFLGYEAIGKKRWQNRHAPNVSNEKLVALDRDKMWEIFKAGELIPVPKSIRENVNLINLVFDRVCERFGQPSQRCECKGVSVDKIALIIHKDNVDCGVSYEDEPQLFEKRQAKAIHKLITNQRDMK